MGAILQAVDRRIQRLDQSLTEAQCLTGSGLKWIAALTMLLDHTSKILLQRFLLAYGGSLPPALYRLLAGPARSLLQGVGTIAFPLFCFLLAEGFLHTRSRARYLGRVFLFALLSEIPFDLGFFSSTSLREGTFPFYFRYQNVLFTLFLGLLALLCLARFSWKPEGKRPRLLALALQGISAALLAAMAQWLHCDYGMKGVLYIIAFYLCRGKRIYQVLLFLLIYMAATAGPPSVFTLMACLLILLYNGAPGRRMPKYFFYGFYPLHILALYGLRRLLGL